MNTFDDDIRKALDRGADPEHVMHAGDEGLFAQIAATFRSKMRFWIILIWFWSMVFGVATVLAGIAFFNATTVRDWIMYATAFLLAIQAVSFLKMWYYLEMNRYTHSREIKRLELQIARLHRPANEGE